MRVTDSMRTSSYMAAQSAASSKLYKATRTASSGEKIAEPSDGPAAFGRIAANDATLAKLQARGAGIDRAAGEATLAEGALASAGDIMTRARELAIQMADGSMGASERAVAANELTHLRQSLVAVANTKGPGGYIFGGSKTDTPPFSNTGVFSGNDDALRVETSDGVLTRRNASGATAFTSLGGRDVFQDLADLEQALSTNNAAGISASVSAMESSRDQLVGERAVSGILMDKLTMSRGAVDSLELIVTQDRASDAEIDQVQAYTQLADAHEAYERSLEVTRKVLSLFEIDRMR